ncbi:MAG: hypothetical protein KOO62_09335 [candidate division Zixibacteria bacterium]|nr:hypothetical protein [candidate division Zixibacteria bacterium]
MDLKALKNIRVVDRDRICSFEWSQQSNDTDGLTLDEIRLVRHPFLAMALDDGFLLLENRPDFDALAAASLNHFPLQIATPESISLATIQLGLAGFNIEHLTGLAAKYPDQIVIERSSEKELSSSDTLSVDFDFGKEQLRCQLRHSSRAGCPASLDHLVHSIHCHGRYEQIVEPSGATGNITRSGSYSAIMTLPSFSLNDLVSAALSDHLFPPDFIGVMTNCRILNIDFPISVLADDTPVEEKEAFFRELVNLRAQSHKVSIYDGKVYVLNH